MMWIHEIHVFELWIWTKSSVYDACCENYLSDSKRKPWKMFLNFDAFLLVLFQ